ncbi:ketosteroid isomerase-like protein [Sphingomonas sp. UYAg733]
MTDQTAFFTALEDDFNAAMVSNDVDRIAACIADDWALVTPEIGPVSRERILSVIGNGMLSHDMMVKQVVRVKVYGDTAVVTGRGQNSGAFDGKSISADEWITDIYRRDGDRWLCVLTHLTPAQN